MLTLRVSIDGGLSYQMKQAERELSELVESGAKQARREPSIRWIVEGEDKKVLAGGFGELLGRIQP